MQRQGSHVKLIPVVVRSKTDDVNMSLGQIKSTILLSRMCTEDRTSKSTMAVFQPLQIEDLQTRKISTGMAPSSDHACLRLPREGHIEVQQEAHGPDSIAESPHESVLLVSVGRNRAGLNATLQIINCESVHEGGWTLNCLYFCSVWHEARNVVRGSVGVGVLNHSFRVEEFRA
jgi:hypothetical protein